MAPPSTPDKYPPSTAFDKKIEIKVGSSKRKSFFMHKGVLRFYSDYFAAAFATDSWLESKDSVFDLSTEEIAVFERFQYWAYTRRLRGPEETGPPAMGWTDITDLWIFGDRRNIPLLQNDAIDLLRTKVVAIWEIPTYEINNVYTNTTDACKLRNFIIEVIGRTSGPDSTDLKSLRNKWNKDALIDLLGVVWKPEKVTWLKEDVAGLDMCQYHVHEEGVKCDVASTV